MSEGYKIDEESCNSGFSDSDSDNEETSEVRGYTNDVYGEEENFGVFTDRKTTTDKEMIIGNRDTGHVTGTIPCIIIEDGDTGESYDIDQVTEQHSRQAPDIIIEDGDDSNALEMKARLIPNVKMKGDEIGGAGHMNMAALEDFTAAEDGLSDNLSRPVYMSSRKAIRNFSEVFIKRPHQVERTSSAPTNQTNPGITTTRSSIFRQGSCVQEGPRIHTEVISNDKTDGFLLSSTRDEEKAKRLKAIIERSECVIERHKTKTNFLTLNIRGTAFDKTYAMLKERKCVYITGKVGSGKTHTALDVISRFMEEFEMFQPMIIESPFDLVSLENTASCVIVLADDLVAIENCEESIANGWRHVMKYVIPLIERKRICFILTSESSNIDAFDKETRSLHGLLDKQNLILLDEKDVCLSEKQQNKMLTAYCKHFFKPLFTHPKEIEDFVQAHTSSFGFPLICNLVGIGGSATLFSDPYSALCAFVSEQYEHHFPSFFLLVLVLITEKDCSLLNFQHNNLSSFEKVSEILSSQKCSHSEVSIGLTRLKRQNILFEEESGKISFTHEIIAAAVLCHLFKTCTIEDIIPLLPVHVINALTILPDSYFQNSDSIAHPFKSQHENCKEALRLVVSNFSNALDSKQPEDFINVASSQMWAVNSFVDTVFTVLGYQFFFVEDVHKTPLSCYLLRVGNVTPISRLVDYMCSKPPQIVAMTKTAIEKTKEEAGRLNEIEIFKQLFMVSRESDNNLIHAAIEGSNVNILKLAMFEDIDDSRVVSREMLQMACQYGNFDAMKYLFNKMENRLSSNVSKLIEMRRHNSKGETLLHYAALGGNVSIFEFLLEQRCDPSSHTHEGNSVLHIAAMFGRFQMVRFLCSRFPDLLRDKNQYEFTCAHLAVREGHDDVLQILIARESNIVDKVKGGNTMLHLAAVNGHLEIIRFMQVLNPMQQNTANTNSLLPVHLAVKYGSVAGLNLFLKTGTDIMTKTVDKRSFLHLAAFNSQLDIVRYLCTCKSEMINELDIEGNTVGHDAAAGGDINVLKYLVDKGVDPLSVNKFNTNLLHEASFNGHLGMVRYLCANYPSLMSQVTENGYTACFGAAVCGNVDILKFLVDNGADVKHSSTEGSTVLHEAAFSGKLDMVHYLCTNFPELKQVRNRKTYLACHFAAQEGHLEVLDLLLTGESMPLPTTSENQTLLHIASYNGMVLVVKYLCNKYPALISCFDKEKSTALHYAARGGHKEVLQYLVDNGLDSASCTQSGSTILHLAAYDGNTDLVIYICKTYPELIQVLDSTGHSAAHYAAGSGEIPLLMNILQYGIDPLLRSSNGSTLLQKAAYNGRLEMVQYLCTKYPELIAMNDAFGCNALHYAACGENIDLIQYLLSLGVDPQSLTNDGHTILHVAAFHDQVNLLNYISKAYPNLLYVRDHSGKTPEQIANENDRKQVVKYFRLMKRPETQPSTPTSIGMLTDVCCCEGTRVLEQIRNAVGSILCCCRR